MASFGRDNGGLVIAETPTNRLYRRTIGGNRTHPKRLWMASE